MNHWNAKMNQWQRGDRHSQELCFFFVVFFFMNPERAHFKWRLRAFPLGWNHPLRWMNGWIMCMDVNFGPLMYSSIWALFQARPIVCHVRSFWTFPRQHAFVEHARFSNFSVIHWKKYIWKKVVLFELVKYNGVDSFINVWNLIM